jgi:hypothetical protein
MGGVPSPAYGFTSIGVQRPLSTAWLNAAHAHGDISAMRPRNRRETLIVSCAANHHRLSCCQSNSIRSCWPCGMYLYERLAIVAGLTLC